MWDVISYSLLGHFDWQVVWTVKSDSLWPLCVLFSVSLSGPHCRPDHREGFILRSWSELWQGLLLHLPRRYYQTVDVPLLHGSQRLGEGAINLLFGPLCHAVIIDICELTPWLVRVTWVCLGIMGNGVCLGLLKTGLLKNNIILRLCSKVVFLVFYIIVTVGLWIWFSYRNRTEPKRYGFTYIAKWDFLSHSLHTS